MDRSDWILAVVRLTTQRMPGIEARVALALAEELHESWPGLTPAEATAAYWDAELVPA
jgi:hypothetical protein